MANLVKELRDTMSLRSVRVLVSPTPVTFAERRSVLALLQKSGPIEHFKMVQSYHSNFVALTKDTNTADSLINRSPITYQVTLPRPSASTSLGAKQKRIPLESVEETLPEELRTEEASSSGQEIRSFTLNIWPAEDYNHGYSTITSPLYHSWPSAYKHDRSFAVQVLQQTVPKTIAGEGLVHWLTDLGKGVSRWTSRERVQMNNWLPSKMLKRHQLEAEAKNRPSAPLTPTTPLGNKSDPFSQLRQGRRG